MLYYYENKEKVHKKQKERRERDKKEFKKNNASDIRERKLKF